MNEYTSVLKWIDEQQETMIHHVQTWCNINSGSSNIHGINETLISIKKSLPIDWSSKLLDLPDFDGKPSAQALFIGMRPDAPIKIFFSGHADTVYPSDSPFQTVKQTDPDTLNGPGVADMKGGLCVFLKALEAFEKFPDKKNVGWEVLINPDEETGSHSSRHLLEKFAKRCDLGLVYEPSFPDGTLVSSRKGVAKITISSHGKSAHAGRDFHQGKNAIVGLAHVITKIHNLNSVDSPITINVGKINGGAALNIVPDFAVCYLNIRFDTEENFEKIKINIQEIIDSTKIEGVNFKASTDYSRPPKTFNDDSQKIYKDVRLCGRELGMTLSWKPSGGASDANILEHAGMTTVDTLGVVGGEIHTHQEYIKISSLIQRAKLSALFLMKLAKGEINIPIKNKRDYSNDQI
jgi:glutamate carboxypeptidase